MVAVIEGFHCRSKQLEMSQWGCISTDTRLATWASHIINMRIGYVFFEPWVWCLFVMFIIILIIMHFSAPQYLRKMESSIVKRIGGK